MANYAQFVIQRFNYEQGFHKFRAFLPQKRVRKAAASTKQLPTVTLVSAEVKCDRHVTRPNGGSGRWMKKMRRKGPIFKGDFTVKCYEYIRLKLTHRSYLGPTFVKNPRYISYVDQIYKRIKHVP